MITEATQTCCCWPWLAAVSTTYVLSCFLPVKFSDDVDKGALPRFAKLEVASAGLIKPGNGPWITRRAFQTSEMREAINFPIEPVLLCNACFVGQRGQRSPLVWFTRLVSVECLIEWYKSVRHTGNESNRCENCGAAVNDSKVVGFYHTCALFKVI